MSLPLLDKLLAMASIASKAGLNLGVGATPTSPVDGDVWNTAAGLFFRSAGVTRGVSLGKTTDEFTLTTGQTTATLTYTPASQADIAAYIGTVKQDPANITGLSGKVVTFGAIPASANGRTLYLEYTRLD